MHADGSEFNVKHTYSSSLLASVWFLLAYCEKKSKGAMLRTLL
ncbi:hypothetical protein SBF1_2640010 [Candidatus Desulfosporosinus infrequens]|uniref:Uncharacterized protein n=1 Tax=Candidatus Desulfosporosinus infrequens TaxID=2043169 RepID=A0A2U3KSA4_9FIRM|nr:hypothetical protein SBF1_2640010 [Candidatus Desulfosporosinus infrequens]